MEYLYWIFNQFSFGGSAESTVSYRSWYEALEKPFFAPEPFVFGLAWGIIYPLIALALIWTLYLKLKSRVPSGFVYLFLLNLALNLTFTPTLITTQSNTLISLHIILVLGTLAWLMLRAWRYSKVVFVLLIPYLLWGAFATVLQISLTALN
jgi:benzodiazapine receptor